MCDCFRLICKCRKFYVPIHITDFKYERGIIKQVCCPFCNYKGPEHKNKKYLTNEDGEFAVGNFIFHSGEAPGKVYKEEIVFSPKSRRIMGRFAIEFNKRHKDYKSAQEFLDENVSFNGNPNDAENLACDCYRYNCRNKDKRKAYNEFLKMLQDEDYCKKYRKAIWEIGKLRRYDCEYLKKNLP